MSRLVYTSYQKAEKTTFNLPNGEIRSFLQVGDEVTFRGASIKEGYPRIGFGEVVGRVLPPVGSK